MDAASRPRLLEVDSFSKQWAKSSRSDTSGGSCVEVASHIEEVHIRSSRNRLGRTITVPIAAWPLFLDLATGRALGSRGQS
ncbi:hypothetical protein JOD54_005267 [Actinokineospora baliensis]|uniref:DUF397 domain-containing protein n=1 Tax=Actinokineospora baliensis TaxID=547056 RepID=UPI00195CE175|nr:hypothetical protein [Actinokineospora baliensis]